MAGCHVNWLVVDPGRESDSDPGPRHFCRGRSTSGCHLLRWVRPSGLPPEVPDSRAGLPQFGVDGRADQARSVTQSDSDTPERLSERAGAMRRLEVRLGLIDTGRVRA